MMEFWEYLDKEREEEEREELRRSKLTKAEIEVEDEAKYRADQEKEENLLRWDRERWEEERIRDEILEECREEEELYKKYGVKGESKSEFLERKKDQKYYEENQERINAEWKKEREDSQRQTPVRMIIIMVIIVIVIKWLFSI